MSIHYHSDELLTTHQLLLEQDGERFRLLDYATLQPITKARYKAFTAARRARDKSGVEDESYD